MIVERSFLTIVQRSFKDPFLRSIVESNNNNSRFCRSFFPLVERLGSLNDLFNDPSSRSFNDPLVRSLIDPLVRSLNDKMKESLNDHLFFRSLNNPLQRSLFTMIISLTTVDIDSSYQVFVFPPVNLINGGVVPTLFPKSGTGYGLGYRF